jgi:hypothetical protein
MDRRRDRLPRPRPSRSSLRLTADTALCWGHRRARGRERTACPRLREPSLRSGLFTQRIETLQGARDAVAGSQTRRRGARPVSALPAPSAQLFVAAVLGAAPLMPLSAASFAGRVASYSICSAPLPRR